MCACNTWGNLGINNNNLYNNNMGVLGLNNSNNCGCGNNTGNLGTSSSNCSACNDNGNLGINNCPCNSCNSRNNTATLGASDRNLNDALANNIGRRCCCEFVVGNTLVKRSGILCQVGNNYIALASNNSNCNTCMFCSTCNLNFIRIE